MKAIVLGATGAVGKDLVDSLLSDERFAEVDIFVRRAVERSHPKLRVHVVNFDDIDSWQHEIRGDVLFSCLGTTLRAAGSQAEQYRVDYTYQYEFARAAADNAVGTYVLVSSAMADPDSRLFYIRMKGELDRAVQALRFRRVVILRPPSLLRKGSIRRGENFVVTLLKILNRVGLLLNRRPMPTEVVAMCMIAAATGTYEGILEAADIWLMHEGLSG